MGQRAIKACYRSKTPVSYGRFPREKKLNSKACGIQRQGNDWGKDYQSPLSVLSVDFARSLWFRSIFWLESPLNLGSFSDLPFKPSIL